MMFIASFPRPQLTKAGSQGTTLRTLWFNMYQSILQLPLKKIKTIVHACVLLKVPIGAQVLQHAVGLIALHLHIPNLHSHGWLAARQLHQVLLQTHEMALVQY